MKRRTFLYSVASGAFSASTGAMAQSYPSRPVRLIVPFAPGGSADVIARIINEAMSRHLGQPVVVENKAGAGGAIGTMEVVRAAPDGYTLAMVTSSNTGAGPAFNPKIGYRPVTDFTPIIKVADGPWIIAVHPSFPARTYKDFVAELKRSPARYSYASSGLGGILHLQMELFKSLTGTFVTHIPYRGAGPAVADVLAGQLHIVLDSPTSLPYINDGRLIPIVVAAPQRMKGHPNVPTFAEAGLPNLNRMSHWGIIGPRGIPADLVTRINTAVKLSLEDSSVRHRLEAANIYIAASSPEEFGRDIKDLYEDLQRVVVSRNLTLE